MRVSLTDAPAALASAGSAAGGEESRRAAARADGVKVISRAASILRLVVASSPGPTILEVARDLGLPRSTVYRIVGALAAEGLLRVVDDRRLLPGGVLAATPETKASAVADITDADSAAANDAGLEALACRVAELSKQVEALRAHLGAADAGHPARVPTAEAPSPRRLSALPGSASGRAHGRNRQ